MKIEKPFHIYDMTAKYSSMAFRKRKHQYLGLPGEYCRRYPTEVVLRNMETGRMDELYSVSKIDKNTGKLMEYMLIDHEDESNDVRESSLRKFGKYKTFGSFIYSLPMFTAVTCKKNPKNFPKEYEITKTDILRPHYIHFSDEKLLEKYENIINKVKQNMELTDTEALDIAFIPNYISKKHSIAITKSLAKIFSSAKIQDKELKMDIAVILRLMILNNIPSEKEQEKLIKGINMRKYENDMEEIIYDIFGKELEEKDQKIEEKDQKIEEKNAELKKIKQDYAQGLEQLNKMEDLNTPQAQKIISSLLLLQK